MIRLMSFHLVEAGTDAGHCILHASVPTILSVLSTPPMSTVSIIKSSFPTTMPVFPFPRFPLLPWNGYPFDCCSLFRSNSFLEPRAFNEGMDAHHIPRCTSTMDQVFIGTVS